MNWKDAQVGFAVGLLVENIMVSSVFCLMTFSFAITRWVMFTCSVRYHGIPKAQAVDSLPSTSFKSNSGT